MSSTELIMNEKIKHLEEILKEYKAETERLSKNNEIAKLNLESSKFEIEKLQKEVMTKIKSIGLFKAKQQNKSPFEGQYRRSNRFSKNNESKLSSNQKN